MLDPQKNKSKMNAIDDPKSVNNLSFKSTLMCITFSRLPR